VSSPQHPASTLQAAAHSGGGGYCCRQPLLLWFPASSSEIGGETWPLAPDPPCEQLLQWWVSGAGHLSPVLLPHPALLSWLRRTHKPPYEQLLVGMVVGAMSSLPLGPQRCSPDPLLSSVASSSPPWPIRTSVPPYEQWLVGVGAGAVSLPVI
jgi:hypothetical protein